MLKSREYGIDAGTHKVLKLNGPTHVLTSPGPQLSRNQKVNGVEGVKPVIFKGEPEVDCITPVLGVTPVLSIIYCAS